jgi:hypothetical protein
MIQEIFTKRDLKRFIYFVKDLYKDDPHYIYPLFYILFKELQKEVLSDKTYKAIISVNENNDIEGRLLYTFEHNQKEGIDICYWSYFDCVKDQNVCNQLFNYMETDMIKNNIKISEGSFTPYDPDNRRGVLINGFDYDPVIFTSYNKDYYPEFLETYGFKKNRDTFSVIPVINQENRQRLDKLARFFERRYDVRIDKISFKDIDKEIKDIHSVLLEADNHHIYQETPSIELIKEVANSLRAFLDPRIIRIARENETNKPIGFAFCLLDFNQVFKKYKGKFRPLRMLLYKRKITKVRGMMQYVVPKYQSTGLNAYIYKTIFDVFEEMGIKEFEAGTMMEGNVKALTSFSKFGGEISKTFRLYRKELQS